MARVEDVERKGKLVIPMLKAALENQHKRMMLATVAGARAPVPEVTIMGNKAIPYRLLKKVMATCTDAGYGKISLAVMQKPIQES